MIGGLIILSAGAVLITWFIIREMRNVRKVQGRAVGARERVKVEGNSQPPPYHVEGSL